ncbi:MAG TPA: type II toxin-antitoxin system VapC family toxin [Polyangia bacterium]|jgi:PIN domain nuclease of toxin-antitoxin system|nr:type II toxin-antitoxin system VapC family toxin [Polyangia bacterium]
MRLLLDTHAFLWWWQGSTKIDARTRTAIAGADVVLVSATSAWEMAIKSALGRLRFSGSIARAVEACGFTKLGVDFEHIETLRNLPLHHNDPFDRLLVAQAMVERATLVTHDRALAPYGLPTLWF